jgi:membrane-bound metal-dependent hydrolase YbcI (DUF457 family)
MTGKGHTLVGLISSVGLYHFITTSTNGDTYVAILAGLAFIFGSTAPDWLELRSPKGGTFIKHRTWTHWLLPWMFLFSFSISQSGLHIDFTSQSEYFDYIKDYINIDLNQYASSILLGFSLGGILHLLVDLPNPMGIPILTPFHRFSLKLWKSGKFEPAICFVALIVNLVYANFIVLNI